jgi:IS66 C-terminal element
VGVAASLTASAKRHGLDPFAWLRDVLRRLPAIRTTAHPTPAGLLQPLLPDAWAATV